VFERGAERPGHGADARGDGGQVGVGARVGADGDGEGGERVAGQAHGRGDRAVGQARLAAVCGIAAGADALKLGSQVTRVDWRAAAGALGESGEQALAPGVAVGEQDLAGALLSAGASAPSIGVGTGLLGSASTMHTTSV